MEVDEEDIDGTIMSINVKNFFCHVDYTVDFNKKITYLVGSNGSGKSAIVTALVVGLGGKAVVTDRGTNLKDFIKKGADSASVTIKIKNSSPTAFKPDIYKKFITVVREFSMSGNSTYKVKDSLGKVISTKYQEVQDIVVAHNIQVENPISVLNQDNARSFHDNDDKKKFTFFRKATTLDKTETLYKKALDLCKRAEQKLELKQSGRQHLKKELDKWDNLHKKMLSREENEKRLVDEYYWAEVVELERALEVKRERQRKLEENIARLQADLDRLDNCDDTVGQAERELREAEEARAAAEVQLQAAQDALAAHEAAEHRRRLAARDLRDRHQLETSKLRMLDDEIQNLRSGGNEAARAGLEARQAECAAASEEARARLSTAEHAARQAREQATRAADRHREASERLRALRAETESARRRVQQQQRAGASPLDVFGSEMVELRRRVDAAVARGQFSQPPRGPVGAHITLRDPQWGSALEHILGGSLSSFCANNGEDARTLNRIIAEVYGMGGRGGEGARPPSVSFSGFRRQAHDVAGEAVRVRGLTNALDALRIDDPVVANYLIDTHGLESVLLVPDEERAMELTSGRQPPPANLRRVVTRQCAEYYPAPNYRSYGSRARHVRYLHQDVADRTRQLQEELSACEQAERAAAAAAEQAEGESARAASTRREHERSLRALRENCVAADTRLAEANAALRDHHAPTLHALEEERRLLPERVAAIEKEQRQRAEEAEAAAAAGDELRAQERAAADQLAAARRRCTELHERVRKQQSEAQQAGTKAVSLRRQVEQLASQRDSAHAALAADAAEVDAKRLEAAELCPRIANPRSTRELRQLREEALAQLRQAVGTSMSREDVLRRYVDAQEKWNALKVALKRNAELIDEIRKVATIYLVRCCDLQKDIVSNVQLSFKRILERRQYSGSLSVDLALGTLTVLCAGERGRRRDAASMSGGERSYATVALLLALWECIDLPFFFLDEYNIFMDSVNQQVVLDMFDEHAMRHPGRQYVFATPLRPNVRESEFVDIWSMSPNM